MYAQDSDDSLVYRKSPVQFSCNDNTFDDKEMNLTVPASLLNNGSYYAHIIMSQFGYPFDEKDEDYDNTRVLYRTHPLIAYKKKREKKKSKLIILF